VANYSLEGLENEVLCCPARTATVTGDALRRYDIVQEVIGS
jgi:hypothetical protein